MLGAGRAAVLSHDAYYHDLSHLPMSRRIEVNVDHPDALETSLIVEHVDLLRSGQSVEMPAYDYVSQTRGKSGIPIEPAPVIIIEGMLAQVLTDHRLRPAKAPLTKRHCHGKLLVVQITKLTTVINCLLDGGGDIVWVIICQFAGGEPLQYLCKLVARAGIAAKIINRFVHHTQMCRFSGHCCCPYSQICWCRARHASWQDSGFAPETQKPAATPLQFCESRPILCR